MKNNYKILFWSIAITLLFHITCGNVFAVVPILKDTTKTIYLKDNRPNRPKFDAKIINKDFESFMLKISAVRASSPALTKNVSTVSATKTNSNVLESQNQKPIDNVKIYPNPVSTQINLSYTLAKDNIVTVKILDVLGNEVATLLSQKVTAGEQTNTFNLTTKLNSGLYFVRIVSGSESIIKRISVL